MTVPPPASAAGAPAAAAAATTTTTTPSTSVTTANTNSNSNSNSNAIDPTIALILDNLPGLPASTGDPLPVPLTTTTNPAMPTGGFRPPPQPQPQPHTQPQPQPQPQPHAHAHAHAHASGPPLARPLAPPPPGMTIAEQQHYFYQIFVNNPAAATQYMATRPPPPPPPHHPTHPTHPPQMSMPMSTSMPPPPPVTSMSGSMPGSMPVAMSMSMSMYPPAQSAPNAHAFALPPAGTFSASAAPMAPSLTTTPPILPRTGSMGPGFAASKPPAAAATAASSAAASASASSFKPTLGAPKRAASTSLLSSAASSRASSPSPGTGTLTPQSASAVTAAGFNAVHVHMTPEAKREIVQLHEQQKKGAITSQEFVARAKELLGEEGFGSFMPGQQGPRVVTTGSGAGTSSGLVPGKKRVQEGVVGKGSKKIKVMQKPVAVPAAASASASSSAMGGMQGKAPDSSVQSAPTPQLASATTTAYPPAPAPPTSTSTSDPRPLHASDLALPRPGTLPMPDPLAQLVNLPLLQTTLEYQAGAAGLKHVSESAIMYLALALQDRLRAVVERAVRVADGRVGAEVAREVAGVRAAVGKVGAEGRVMGFDVKVTGNPWAALDVVRVKEEKTAEELADTDRMDVDPAAPSSTTAAAPKQRPAAAAAASLVTSSAATRTPTPGATAFLAAGGAAKSWMTMGTGGSSAAATAAAMFGASAARAKKKNKEGASPKVGAVRSSALAAASGVAIGVPGTGAGKHRKLTARDVLMAVQMSGPEEGGGKVNARGVGGVVARGWMRVRQK